MVWKYALSDEFSFITTVSYNFFNYDDVDDDFGSAEFHIVGKVRGYRKKCLITLSKIFFVKNITTGEIYVKPVSDCKPANSSLMPASSLRDQRRWEECEWVAEKTAHYDLCNIETGAEISDLLLRELLLKLEQQWLDSCRGRHYDY